MRPWDTESPVLDSFGAGLVLAMSLITHVFYWLVGNKYYAASIASGTLVFATILQWRTLQTRRQMSPYLQTVPPVEHVLGVMPAVILLSTLLMWPSTLLMDLTIMRALCIFVKVQDLWVCTTAARAKSAAIRTGPPPLRRIPSEPLFQEEESKLYNEAQWEYDVQFIVATGAIAELVFVEALIVWGLEAPSVTKALALFVPNLSTAATSYHLIREVQSYHNHRRCVNSRTVRSEIHITDSVFSNGAFWPPYQICRIIPGCTCTVLELFSSNHSGGHPPQLVLSPSSDIRVVRGLDSTAHENVLKCGDYVSFTAQGRAETLGGTTESTCFEVVRITACSLEVRNRFRQLASSPNLETRKGIQADWTAISLGDGDCVPATCCDGEYRVLTHVPGGWDEAESDDVVVVNMPNGVPPRSRIGGPPPTTR